MFRFAIVTLLCGLAAAQQSSKPAPSATPAPASPQAEQVPGTNFRVGVQEVVAPVLVTNRDGNFVEGLRPDQFRLFDNSKEQNIHADVTFIPLSLVIAVQASAGVDRILPQVTRIGSLIGQSILGETGEAAVIAYDSRVRTLQEFTTDSDKITQAVRKIYPGSMSVHMVDAVSEGIRMLRTRPKERRRIMLLIGETRDMGSAARTRETLIELQLANVAFYSVDMSRFISTLTTGPQPGRPDPLPPAARPLPSNVPATPTTVQQTWGTQAGSAEFLPLMLEIFRDVKAIFKANPVELFTKGTGGTETEFYRQRGLEEAVARIGAQLHSQYLITYAPNNKDEGGFHQIAVEVIGHPEYKVLTRPGYWLASVQ